VQKSPPPPASGRQGPPTAWEIAGSEAAWRARQESAVAALRRDGITTVENVSVAIGLADRELRFRHGFRKTVAVLIDDDGLSARIGAERHSCQA
jgi:hypothetical protein